MRIVRYILFCSLALILVKAEDLGGAKKSAKGCDVTLLIKLFLQILVWFGKKNAKLIEYDFFYLVIFFSYVPRGQ